MAARLFFSRKEKSTKKKISFLGLYPALTIFVILASPFYLAFVFCVWLCSGQKGFDWLLWVAVKFGIPLYPVSQEDSTIERRVLKQKGARIVTICASGDRVLESMAEEPEQIIAVDLNPAQLALFDLKLACMKNLEYEDIVSIFHNLDSKLLAKHLPKLMKSFRSKESILFWKKMGANYLNCLYNRGTSGAGYKIANKMVGWFTGVDLRTIVEDLEGAPDYWNREVKQSVGALLQYLWHLPFAWNALCVPLRLALGVPPRQGSLRGCICESPKALLEYLDRIIGSPKFKDNHYFVAGVLGQFTDTKPYWLRRENTELIKKQINKCFLMKGYFSEILRSLPDDSVDCLLLSDHMDWMEQNDILEEWEQIQRVGTKNCQIMWRTAGITEVFYPHCLSCMEFEKQDVLDDFLANEDQYPSYRHHLINFNSQKQDLQFILRNDVEPYRSIFSDLQNVFYILYKGILGRISAWTGNRIENWSEFFYQGQAKTYDSFRHMMLHGRKRMMDILPIKKGTVWADIGCGTGFNIEYLADWICTDDVEHLFLVDYSPSMLEQAKIRIKKLGIEHKTTFIECDCSKGINLPQKVNLITFSYSLCMIPGWETALRSAVDNLEKGGYIGACDFTESDEQLTIFRLFWKYWFKNDHVFLSRKHLEVLQETTLPKVSSLRFGSLPYILLFKVPYYVYLGMKQ